jgi:hypothetical protein
VTKNRPVSSTSARERKLLRDRRVAALSLDLVAPENRRLTRALLQVQLAGELHDAMFLCLKDGLPMPLAALLRSLIDTAVLGIWFIKYASDVDASGSVAELSTAQLVKEQFADEEDRRMFMFVFEAVQGTDHESYRDVLHPSIHGDGLHLAMRIRNEPSQKSWLLKCAVHANHVYCHFLLALAKSGTVPEHLREYIQMESARSIRAIKVLLEEKDRQGIEERLVE